MEAIAGFLIQSSHTQKPSFVRYFHRSLIRNSAVICYSGPYSQDSIFLQTIGIRWNSLERPARNVNSITGNRESNPSDIHHKIRLYLPTPIANGIARIPRIISRRFRRLRSHMNFSIWAVVSIVSPCHSLITSGLSDVPLWIRGILSARASLEWGPH